MVKTIARKMVRKTVIRKFLSDKLHVVLCKRLKKVIGNFLCKRLKIVNFFLFKTYNFFGGRGGYRPGDPQP